MTERITENLHTEVAARIERRTGLSCAGAGDQRLRRALEQTLTGLGSAESSTPLQVTDGFITRLSENLTVQESYFFREPRRLNLAGERLRDVARGRAAPVHVWSAGCAAGEEAYTLAALCLQLGLGDRARVLGTDLSPAAISAARRGRYSRWSVRGLDQARILELFEAEEDGLHVRARVRANVSFEVHNILERRPAEWPRFDLILCRNVLIYFTPEAAHRAIAGLVDALAPGGWLVLGASDPLADSVSELQTVATADGLVYRRSSPTASSSRTSATRPVSRSVGPSRAQAFRPSASSSSTPVNRWAPSLESARRALSAGRPMDAEGLTRAVLEESPLDKPARLLLVQSLAEQNRLPEAVGAAAQAVMLFPTDADARQMQAVVHLQFGDLQQAARAARQALYLDPSRPEAHLVLGRALELMGRSGAAHRARRNGHRLLPTTGEP